MPTAPNRQSFIVRFSLFISRQVGDHAVVGGKSATTGSAPILPFLVYPMFVTLHAGGDPLKSDLIRHFFGFQHRLQETTDFLDCWRRPFFDNLWGGIFPWNPERAVKIGLVVGESKQLLNSLSPLPTARLVTASGAMGTGLTMVGFCKRQKVRFHA